MLQDKVLCRSEVERRKRSLAEIKTVPVCVIDDMKGFEVVGDRFEDGLIADAISEGRSFFDNANPDKMVKGKDYLVSMLPKEGLSQNSDILKLATSPSMVKTVGNYLGCLPILTYVNVWYSRPSTPGTQAEGSQQWHLDHEDLRQVKVFIYCEDVDESAGTLKVVRADDSLSHIHTLGYRTTAEKKRLQDDAIPC